MTLVTNNEADFAGWSVKQTRMIVDSALVAVGAAITFLTLTAVACANSAINEIPHWDEWELWAGALVIAGLFAAGAIIIGILWLQSIRWRTRADAPRDTDMGSEP